MAKILVLLLAAAIGAAQERVPPAKVQIPVTRAVYVCPDGYRLWFSQRQVSEYHEMFVVMKTVWFLYEQKDFENSMTQPYAEEWACFKGDPNKPKEVPHVR